MQWSLEISALQAKQNSAQSPFAQIVYLPQSLRASSPIWASEASRARAREGAATLACLSRVHFSRYPPNGELARRLKIFGKIILNSS